MIIDPAGQRAVTDYRVCGVADEPCLARVAAAHRPDPPAARPLRRTRLPRRRRPRIWTQRRRRTADALRALDHFAALPGAAPARNHRPGAAPYDRGTADGWAATRFEHHDPALQPARDDQDLVAGEPLPDLVRDRGVCLRRAGGARDHPGERRARRMGARQVRGRAHRRDRARDPPRRDRLSDQPRRACRPRGALCAPGDDLERCARHLLRGAAERGRRHPAGRSRRVARSAEAARLRAQIHADGRAQPRHPRRADDLRIEARRALRRVRAQPRPPCRRAQGSRDLRDLGRGRHLRQYRSRGSRRMSRKSSASSPSRSRRR